MKPRLLLLFLSLIVVSASAADTKAPASTTPVTPAPAASTAAAPASVNAAARNPAPAVAPAETFESKFRLITDRNIFNANRTGRPIRNEAAPAPRTDIITLYGVMDSDKGLRAFFDGTEASYRKALHVGDSVDKFKVIKIEPKVVELERDGKTLAVNVGQQLRRPEGADWTLAADLQPRAGVMAAPSRADPNAPVEIPANADEVTRRLMERRAKTLKN